MIPAVKAKLLEGKKGLIVGIANENSIAWGCAKAFRAFGAELAVTYLNDKAKKYVEPLARELEAPIMMPLDVRTPGQTEAVFERIGKDWDVLDFVVHSIAYAPREELEGLYLDAVSRDGFRIAHEISSYSFAAMARAALPLMRGRNGALLTLSYIGAVRSMPGYNVMGLAKASLEANVRYLAQSLGADGIRVNAVSAGPIRTLAASGIKGLRRMMEFTVHSGTSLEAFSDPGGRSYLGGTRVAGKTGTLRPNVNGPTTSWFIGFAPSRAPELVVSVMLDNSPVWRRKANHVARDVFRAYFSEAPGVTHPFASAAR